MKHFKWLHFNLQRFGEGAGDGAGAGTGGPEAGEAPNPGEESAEQELDFDAFLEKNPKYKEAQQKRENARIQKAVKDRFKTQDTQNARMGAMLQKLGDKYGLQPDEKGNWDMDAIDKAMDADDSYYEMQAMEAGKTVEQYKADLARDRELEQYREEDKRRKAEAEERAAFSRINAQAAEAMKTYPGMDINAELENPDFRRLVFGAGVPVQTAFEVIHQKELAQGLAQFTAQETARAAADTIASGKARPVESASGGHPAATANINPSSFTSKNLADIKSMVNGGRRITAADLAAILK